MLTRSRCGSFVLLSVVSCCAIAQTAADITTSLRVSRIVILADGTESHQSAEAARPADVLEYVAEYRNGSTHAVRQLAATLPLPDGTEYVASSAVPAGAQASTDGTHFAPLPLTRKVIQPNGRLADQLVPYREYRFLRWPPQDLGAGKTLQITARARLSAEPTAAAAVRH